LIFDLGFGLVSPDDLEKLILAIEEKKDVALLTIPTHSSCSAQQQDAYEHGRNLFICIWEHCSYVFV
jgi:hypothetical protein